MTASTGPQRVKCAHGVYGLCFYRMHCKESCLKIMAGLPLAALSASLTPLDPRDVRPDRISQR